MGNPYVPIFVVADDLTGAIDTGIYFRNGSQNVRVGFDDTSPWNQRLGDSVIEVYDSETRNLGSEPAYKRVFQAVSLLLPSMPLGSHVYKKVDAALRGNIGVEISAMLKGLNKKVALLAPAFPGTQRTVIDGQLLIGGVPIHQTVFSEDPTNPIYLSDIAALISQTASVSVERIPLSIIRLGPDAIRDYFLNGDENPKVYIADAENDQDLEFLAVAISESDEVLPCGSGGFAQALAKTWSTDSEPNHSFLQSNCDKVLVVIGSAHPQSHRQFAYLQKQLDTHATTIVPCAFADDGERELARVSQQVMAADETIIAIMIGDQRLAIQESARLVFSMAVVVREKIRQWFQQKPGRRVGLIATGGDTVLAIAQALGGIAIWPRGMLMPGIPWSVLELADNEVVLVSKAGSFGSDNTLDSLARWAIAPPNQT